MSGAVTVAIIGAVAAVVVAWIEFGRRSTKRELVPNGGSSLRDAVDRIADAQANADRRAVRLEGKVDKLAAEQAEHMKQAAEESRTIERIARHIALPEES